MNQFDAAMLSNTGRDLGRVLGGAITLRQANEDAIAERLLRQQMQREQLDVSVNEAELGRNQQQRQFDAERQQRDDQYWGNREDANMRLDLDLAHQAAVESRAERQAKAAEAQQAQYAAALKSKEAQEGIRQLADAYDKLQKDVDDGIKTPAQAKAAADAMYQTAMGTAHEIFFKSPMGTLLKDSTWTARKERSSPNSAIMLTVEGIAKLQEQYAAAIVSGDMERAKQIKERIAMAERMASPGSVSVSVEKDPTPADLRRLEKDAKAAEAAAEDYKKRWAITRNVVGLGGLNPLVDTTAEIQDQLTEKALASKEALEAAMAKLGIQKATAAAPAQPTTPQKSNAAPVIKMVPDGKGGYKKAN